MVRADYAQLAPDRFLTVGRERLGDKIQVRLGGVDALTVGGRGTAEAWMEQKDPLVSSPDLGWERVGKVVQLADSTSFGVRFWSGQLSLPAGSARKRLVVQQFERFPAAAIPGAAIRGGVTVRRLVYSDAVEL